MNITDNERFHFFTHEKDVAFLRKAIAVSFESRKNGNTPFGAILSDSEGNILMGQPNMELTTHDCTMHAELGLVRAASQKYSKEFLWNCSLYTSCEPCAMCTGGIYWANVGRIVYAMTEKELLNLTGNDEQNPTFDNDCRSILSHGQKEIIVVGPFPELVKEAAAAHEGYWH